MQLRSAPAELDDSSVADDNSKSKLLRPRNAVETRKPTSLRLMPGLAVTIIAVAVFSVYTVTQLHGLKRIQTEIIDRNRTDSLLLLRIQNALNALGTALRDMVDTNEPYPLTAWRAQFSRIRVDLEDAVAKEASFAPSTRTADQAKYLTDSMAQFWDALDRVFDLAATNEAAARTQVRLSLQARHEALTANVARLLVQNHESEQQAAAQTQHIYAGVERNVYTFVAAMFIVVAITSLHLFRYNRGVFAEVTSLSERRSELARQLIAAQENTLRSMSRELHDDFGQTLTAVGMVLQRTVRGLEPGPLRRELTDVHEIIQTMLDRMRGLSQSLHPVILESMGLEGALDSYIPAYERRTGIAVRFVRSGGALAVERENATHIYRVFQEALNNVARHSGASQVQVRLTSQVDSAILEIEDDGAGFRNVPGSGMGLVSMRERAELLKGRIEFLSGALGGALVRLTIPLEAEVAHARTV